MTPDVVEPEEIGAAGESARSGAVEAGAAAPAAAAAAEEDRVDTAAGADDSSPASEPSETAGEPPSAIVDDDKLGSMRVDDEALLDSPGSGMGESKAECVRDECTAGGADETKK